MENSTSDGLRVSPGVAADMIVYYIVRLIQSTLALGGNLLTIVAVIRTSELHTATDLLVVNLGMADLLGGCTAPMAVVVSLQYGKPSWLPLCIVKEGLTLLVHGGNLYGVLFISLDRYMSVAHPIRHVTCMTMCKARAIMISQWILTFTGISLILSLIPRPRVETVDVLCYYPDLLPLWVLNSFIISQYSIVSCITMWLYIRMGLILWRRDRKVADSRYLTRMFPPHPGRQRKLTRILSLVLGLYYACTLPAIITSNFINIHESNALMDFYHFTIILWYTNSFINPFLYAWQMPAFRKAFWRILHLRPAANQPGG